MTTMAIARLLPSSGLTGSLILLPLLLLVVGLARRSASSLQPSATQPDSTQPDPAPLGSAGPASVGRNWDLWFVGPALLIGGLLHHRLGIPGSDRLVAAALYLYGAVVILRSLPHLTRALGRSSSTTRPGWQFFALPLAFFLTIAPWATSQRPPDGDEPWYLLVVHSLVHDLDDDLSNNYAEQSSLAFMERALEPQPHDPKTKGGALLSRHGMLLPLMLVPGYFVAGFTGAIFTMLLLGSALCWLTVSVHQRMKITRSSTSVLVWALFALTAPLMLYSHQVWVEVPGALLLLLGFDQLRGLAAKGAKEANARWPGKELLTLLTVFILLPILKLRFGVLAAALGGLVALRSRLPRRHVVMMGTASLVALAGVLLYNQRTFGNALRIHNWYELNPLRQEMGTILFRLAGLLYDPAFGLIAFAPIWAVAIPGAWLLFRRQGNIAIDLFVLAAPYTLLVASRSEWYGGWSPPFRYTVIVLPFVAIAAGQALELRHTRGARTLLAPLLVSSAAAGALWTAMPGWTYNFANGTAYWVDQWTRLTGIDWMRLLPSATRPSTASWMVPLFTSIALVLIWVGPTRSLRQRVDGRAAGAFGLGAAVLISIAGIAVIRSLPTRHIEGESVAATKTGGHPEPRKWALDRTLHREGWTLRHGERWTTPVKPDGDTLTLRLALRLFRNRQEDLDLVVFADQRPIGKLRLSRSDEWVTETIGPVDWGDARELTIEVSPPLNQGEPGVVNGVALDFARFQWD